MRIRTKTVMDQMNTEKPDDVLADLEAKHGSPAPFGSALADRDYLQNAVSGLTHYIHETSPIMRDIVAADRDVEEVRQWLLSPNEKLTA